MGGDKKNARRRRARIVFIDESGFSERPSVRCTWAPRGQTPVLSHALRHWQQLSAIGALAYDPSQRGRDQVFLMLRSGVITSSRIVVFLRHLRRQLGGAIFVIWDGINTHRSHQTKGFVQAQRQWLSVYRLPAYAPELNPVEGMWAWFKGSAVANYCPEDLPPLARQLRLARRRLRRRCQTLTGFLAKAGLSF